MESRLFFRQKQMPINKLASLMATSHELKITLCIYNHSLVSNVVHMQQYYTPANNTIHVIIVENAKSYDPKFCA